MMKKINLFKVLFGIFFMLFGLNFPAFADGGIPFWIAAAPSFIATMGYNIADFPFDIRGFLVIVLFTIPVLLIVVLLESLIFKYYFFKKEKYGKLFWITTKANFYSTIVGIIIVCLPLFFYNDYGTYDMLFLGPWAFWGGWAFPIMNLLLLYISYLIEYFVFKREFIDFYEEKSIKKSVLIVNIVSYSLSILMSICVIILLILNLFQ